MQNQFSAVIYVRFSNSEQGKGSTIKRQLDDCRAHCARMGWAVEAELIDDGRSAFNGENREPHRHLGRFEREAAVGLHAGKVLIVERLDRLCRADPNDGYDLLRALSKEGVSVATVDGGAVYEAGKPLPFEQIMMLFLKFYVANEESAKKSDRVRKGKAASREKAREEGRTLTRNLPPWIDLNDAGQRVVREDRAALIRQVFELADSTSKGRSQLTRWLNESGHKPWGEGKRTSQGWSDNFVPRLLANRQVLGEFQPHVFVDGERVQDGEPIQGYFPAVVDAALFERVNAGAPARKEMMGGRKDAQVANLFSGLIKCDQCGGTMRYRCKGKAGTWRIVKGKRYQRTADDALLVCSNADRRNGCTNRATIAYHGFERAMLDACLHLALDDQAFSNRGEVGRLANLIAERNRSIELLRAKANRLWSAWSDDGSEIAKTLAMAAEAEMRELEANLVALERQKEQAKGRAGNKEHLRRVADMRGKLHDPDASVRVPLRAKVAEALRSLISVMWANDQRKVTVVIVGGLGALEVQNGKVVNQANCLRMFSDGDWSALKLRKGQGSVDQVASRLTKALTEQGALRGVG